MNAALMELVALEGRIEALAAGWEATGTSYGRLFAADLRNLLDQP